MAPIRRTYRQEEFEREAERLVDQHERIEAFKRGKSFSKIFWDEYDRMSTYSPVRKTEKNPRTKNLKLINRYTMVHNTFAEMWEDMTESASQSHSKEEIKAYEKAMFEFEGSCQRIQKIMAKRWSGYKRRLYDPWDDIGSVEAEIFPDSEFDSTQKFLNVARPEKILRGMVEAMGEMLESENDGYLKRTIGKTLENIEKLRESLLNKGERYLLS